MCEVPGWGAQLAPERVLAEAAALGLRAVEAGPVGYLGHDSAAIAALLSRHELRLVGGFVPVVLHERSAHPDSLAAARSWGVTLAAAGATFLISAVVVDLAWSPRVPLTERGWRAIVDGLARLDEAAAEIGLTHVTHPHWRTLIETRDDVSRLLERSQALLCLDTGHLVLGGTDPVWLARATAERVAHVHVKDVDETIAERLRRGATTLVEAVQAGLFRPLGEGDAPVADTVHTLERQGYRGWYVLEQDCALPSVDLPDGAGPVEDVRRSIEFIRSAIVAERESHAKEGAST
ncbi:MAG TPA: TIM barrel protein [Gaiellaceae bacterium]|nr:TIM barrel protein [Gaiellaceae bacterium]